MSYTRDLHNVDIPSALTFDLGQGQLISDGATSNRVQVQTPGPRGAVNGVAALTWRGVVTLPSPNWDNTPIFLLSPRTTFHSPGPQVETNVLAGFLSGNTLIILQRGNALASDHRQFQHGFFRTAYAMQTGILEVAFTRGASNPVVRWNDANISSDFVLSTNGVLPDWLDSATLQPTFHTTGLSWASGPAPLGSWILGTLNDADRTFWRTTGQPPLWVRRGNQFGGVTPSFGFETGTLGAFAPFLGVTSTCVVTSSTAASGTFSVELTRGNSAESLGIIRPVPAGTLVGTRLRVVFWARGLAGEGPVAMCGADAGQGTSFSGVFAATNVWQRFEGFITFDTFAWQPWVLFTPTNSAGGVKIWFDDIQIDFAGALSLPDVQAGNILEDLTTLGDNPSALFGMTAICDQPEFSFRKTLSWTGTHEVKSTGLSIPSNAVITQIDTKATAASTGSGLTVGSSNTNARYVTANVFTTAKKVHTLANRLPSAPAANDLNIVVDPDTNNYTGDITICVKGFVTGETI